MESSTLPSSHDLQNGCADSFTWDENSQLFFHSSTGFYHDPHAGWYYSSRDGLYYKFENGSYVLLETDQGDGYKSNFYQDEMHLQDLRENSDRGSCLDVESETCTFEQTNLAKSSLGKTEDIVSQVPENNPPSKWLEETLIDLYLSGYQNQEVHAANDDTSSVKISDLDSYNPAAGDNNFQMLEEGELVEEDSTDEEFLPVPPSTPSQMITLGESVADWLRDFVIDENSYFGSDSSWEEDKWRAQYGQVIQSAGESIPELSAIDLWDWAVVKESKKGGKIGVTKLVGRVVKKSAKLHPSMPSSSGLLKTAPICQVHLDLVRVTTGKLYKLRSPSAKHLASMSSFDSSNPTKEWGFPELSKDWKNTNDCGKEELKSAEAISIDFPASEKSANRVYRDRAHERRKYHGGYGEGPGQKKSLYMKDSDMSPDDDGLESDSTAEAMNMSFGAGSYPRKILQSMGWKEGEGLGKSVKGIVEPIQAIGNIGSAGLGWSNAFSNSK